MNEEQVKAIYVCSSVARGEADAHSDIDLHQVYREPLEDYSRVEEILSHYAKPHNLANGVMLQQVCSG
ncbi:nucleotidyltransferase domain-containing protein [Paenibacillus mesotrionivorans]|uniref:Nucleotidyltransferase domain-containing protein n=1 Tax=Paenibacillus mesotrionivorans TaxID=3160968 RepID=A0ACC7NU51_9BACL